MINEPNNKSTHNGKTVSMLLAETKEELKHFVETRFQIFRAEVGEKVVIWRRAVPLLGIALLLLLTAWLVLTFSLVALVRMAFTDTPYSWLWASLIVGCAYLMSGLAAGWSGLRGIRDSGLTPKRTVTVLKQDKIWIDNERRAA